MPLQPASELPPIARAEAMDQPYQPGRTRRLILVGVAVVAAAIALFLAVIPRAAAPPPIAAAGPPATPTQDVVFPKLQPLRTPAQSH